MSCIIKCMCMMTLIKNMIIVYLNCYAVVVNLEINLQYVLIMLMMMYIIITNQIRLVKHWQVPLILLMEVTVERGQQNFFVIIIFLNVKVIPALFQFVMNLAPNICSLEFVSLISLIPLIC